MDAAYQTMKFKQCDSTALAMLFTTTEMKTEATILKAIQ